jgi:phage anti-repressor protein
MINHFISELGQSVYCTELYDYIETDKGQYSRFIKSKILSNCFAEHGKDYLTALSSENIGKRGQFRQEYILHIDFAKKICMVSKSAKGEEIRNFLVNLTKKVETAEYISSKRVIEIIRFVKIFAVYEHRTKVAKQNLDNFAKNFSGDKKQVYTKFHNWRNEILHLGKEELNKRILDFCVAEKRALPKFKNKDEMLTFMGEYEQIKVAFWDMLTSQNESDAVINNICNLAVEIAKEIQPFLNRLNETNLFFEKIENVELKMLN